MDPRDPDNGAVFKVRVDKGFVKIDEWKGKNGGERVKKVYLISCEIYCKQRKCEETKRGRMRG